MSIIINLKTSLSLIWNPCFLKFYLNCLLVYFF